VHTFFRQIRLLIWSSSYGLTGLGQPVSTTEEVANSWNRDGPSQDLGKEKAPQCFTLKSTVNFKINTCRSMDMHKTGSTVYSICTCVVSLFCIWACVVLLFCNRCWHLALTSMSHFLIRKKQRYCACTNAVSVNCASGFRLRWTEGPYKSEWISNEKWTRASGGQPEDVCV
jgi:hypothetical protein